MENQNGAATTAAKDGIVKVETSQVETLTFVSREAREAYIKSLSNKKNLKIRRFFVVQHSADSVQRIFGAHVHQKIAVKTYTV